MEKSETAKQEQQNDPLRKELPAVTAFGQALRSAGERLADQNSDLSTRLESASQAFEELTARSNEVGSCGQILNYLAENFTFILLQASKLNESDGDETCSYLMDLQRTLSMITWILEIAPMPPRAASPAGV